MVWETRKVCDEASHNQFVCPHLPSLVSTNIENMLGHVPPTYARQSPMLHVNERKRLDGHVADNPWR